MTNDDDTDLTARVDALELATKPEPACSPEWIAALAEHRAGLLARGIEPNDVTPAERAELFERRAAVVGVPMSDLKASFGGLGR